MGHRHSQQRTLRTTVCKGRIANFDPHRYHIANKTKRTIAHERAWQQARLAQNLKAVTGSKNELTRSRLLDHRLHDRRKPSNRAATEIIAIGKTAGENDRVVLAQRRPLMPDVFGLQSSD